MKEAVYKFFTAGLAVLIFLGMLHSMSRLSDLNDYAYSKRAAEKNSGLAAAGYDIPAASAKAPSEAMRTEPAPITVRDLSYFYIDGISFDFPCTLADIREHFETSSFYGYYDEESSEYSGTEILMKNGVGTCLISYTSEARKPMPEECIIRGIRFTSFFGQTGKYFPQAVVSGMDIAHTSDEEYLRLAALDGNEYLATDLIVYPQENGGYIIFDFKNKRIEYYEKDCPDYRRVLGRAEPSLIKTELCLPEDYDIENVSADKEELREFALEYYAYDDDTYITARRYNEEVEITVNDIYLTAYEFLATASDEYNAFYFELKEIESFTNYNSENIREHTGYLKVTADCYIEGYDDPVQMDMILKAGDRLGDALIIQMEF